MNESINAEDTVAAPSFVPTGIRIGADLAPVLLNFLEENRFQYELNADIAIHKYLFNVDYGFAQRSFVGEDLSYQYSGSYFRLGPDMNFMHTDPTNSAFFIGFRYAFGQFASETEGIFRDPTPEAYQSADGTTMEFYGDKPYSYNERGIRAGWFEVVTGLKVLVWNQFFLGYTIRYKFGISTSGEEVLESYAIPGYGLRNGAGLSFHYHVFYRIPYPKSFLKN